MGINALDPVASRRYSFGLFDFSEQRRYRFDWERDYPLKLQQDYPGGQTEIKFQFKLDAKDKGAIGQITGTNPKDVLNVWILLGASPPRTKIEISFHQKTPERTTPELIEYISRNFRLDYIPALRPSKLSLGLIQNQIERKLSTLESNTKYLKARKIVEEFHHQAFRDLEIEVISQLQTLIPNINSISIEQNRRRIGVSTPFRVDPSLSIDDGTDTDFEQKGDGIKSLVAIGLMSAGSTSTRPQPQDLLLAIEEPEAYLHPKAIRQVARVVRSMARDHQVIITTHSPLFVERGSVASNIIVRASTKQIAPARDIREIRDALGVEVEDNLQRARCAIVVEGETDVALIKALTEHFAPPLYDAINEGVISMVPLHGVNNLRYHLHILQEFIVEVAVILDNDEAGKTLIDEAIERGALDPANAFLWNALAQDESEAEDLLNPHWYFPKMAEAINATFDITRFERDRRKWTLRMKSSYEQAGKPWNETVQKTLKADLFSWLEQEPQTALTSEGKELVLNIFNGLQNLLKL